MKFIIVALAALVSVKAVTLKETDNWTEDSLHEFDVGHYANNHVSQMFPEHFAGHVRGENPNTSTADYN